MILSDKSIQQSILNQDGIDVDPLPRGKQIQPASLDVRLGREKYSFKRDRSTRGTEHTLHPGERYLGHTKETVDLPNDIAAQLAGRSSLGRRGVIVHKTAGWIDPGFTGDITLELMNLGDEPVTLAEGERVAQLVFFRLDQMSSGYDGKYQRQQLPTEAKQDNE